MTLSRTLADGQLLLDEKHIRQLTHPWKLGEFADGKHLVYAVSFGHMRTRHHWLWRRILSKKLGQRLTASDRVRYIDGNPLNCTEANLELAPAVNVEVLREKNGGRKTSLFRGVSWDQRSHSWKAAAPAGAGRQKIVYRGADERAAARAYDGAVAHLKRANGTPYPTNRSLGLLKE